MANARDFQFGTSVTKKGGTGFLKRAGYEFQTGIVSEFIEDPDVFLDQQYPGDSLGLIKFRDIFLPNQNNTINVDTLKIPEANLLVKNPELIVDMPRSSIFAYLIDGGASRKNARPFICYPFFPPHFSLPVKPGEHVWILKEFSGGVENYYWLCRKHSTKHVDDINYTFFERSDSVITKLQDVLSGKSNPVSDDDLRNYVGFNQPSPGNLPLSISNNSILLNSVSHDNFTAEPVPPVIRKCGDTLIQGSNNALIHLTTEKFEVSGETSKTDFTKVLLDSRIPSKNRAPFSPAIDICIARKKTDLDALRSGIPGNKADSGDIGVVLNNRGTGNTTLESFEFNKVKDLQKESPLIDAGFDSSALDCGGRIYLSNDCNVDSVFSSTPTLSSLKNVAGPSIVTYSDNNRVISNNSLRLINRNPGSFIDMDSSGNIKIHSKNDVTDVLGSAAIYLQDGASEPYVKYSELSSLLRKILNDLVVLVELKNVVVQIFDALFSATMVVASDSPFGESIEVPNPILPLTAPVSAPYEALKQTLSQAGLNLSESEISLLLGTFTEIVESPSGEMEAMKSTKIFGE